MNMKPLVILIAVMFCLSLATVASAQVLIDDSLNTAPPGAWTKVGGGDDARLDNDRYGDGDWAVGGADGSGFSWAYDNHYYQSFTVANGDFAAGDYTVDVAGWSKAWACWWSGEDWNWLQEAHVELWIDGTMVWSAMSSNNTHRNTWTRHSYSADYTIADSVEVRLRTVKGNSDYGTGGYGAIWYDSRYDDVYLELKTPGIAEVVITDGPHVTEIGPDTATIEWTTNVPANSIVDYGLTAAYGQSITDYNEVTNHSVQLTGLTSGRVYDFRVRSLTYGYVEACSENDTFRTAFNVNPVLTDGSFESGALKPNWYITMGSNDGVADVPWLHGWLAQDGDKFLGAAASWGTKRSVTSQFVEADPSKFYIATAWIRTVSWGGDPWVADPENAQCNLGIDPFGNFDPVFEWWAYPYSNRLANSPAIWFRDGDDWSDCSTQTGTYSSEWRQIAVGAQPDPLADYITVHALMHHMYPLEWSLTGIDNVTLQEACSLPPGPWSPIVNAKLSLNGWPVEITSTVTGAFYEGDMWFPEPTSFAISDADRTAGIRVIWNDYIDAGDNVTVAGATATINGERVIIASSVTVNSSGNAVPAPYTIDSLDAAGGDFGFQTAVANNAAVSPVQYASGMNNVGQLMTLRGKVTAVEVADEWNLSYGDFFYLDDGYEDEWGWVQTGLKDGSGNVGIRCRPASNEWGEPIDLPALGSYVEVTGVMGVTQISPNINVRYFWTADISPATFANFTSGNYQAGMMLISVPAQPKNADPLEVLGGEAIVDRKLWRFNAAMQSLALFDIWDAQAFGAISSSQGYWFSPPMAGSINYEGYAYPAEPLDRWIAVSRGWNIIGAPFTFPTFWDDWKVTDGTVTLTMEEARDMGWLQSQAFWYEASTASLKSLDLLWEFRDRWNVEPWYGHWVQTNTNLGLIAPAVPTSSPGW